MASSSGFSDIVTGEKHVRENEPVVRTDVIKETDSTKHEELPTQGGYILDIYSIIHHKLQKIIGKLKVIKIFMLQEWREIF